MDKQSLAKIVVEVSNLVEEKAYALGKLGSGQSMYTFCLMPDGQIGIDEGSTATYPVDEFINGEMLMWFIERDINLTMDAMHNIRMRSDPDALVDRNKLLTDFVVECHHILTDENQI